ncbi:EAL domain-containing protein [Gilvimarinus xylanilyticus]|uniref:Sensor domain-containing phosphodiesterase n=1 Tax=Gilvimarinus xylanilyticus TaxID=2944139 RepID=A0A9X2I1S4_9GAMM|nr:sensor domain-containing phosphodiesterase [Gilvimarinus xylanilyticus]MCP8900556.1 sensor domain-containing phosphodiesterase [Gilvimarinus xylanilyticus]
MHENERFIQLHKQLMQLSHSEDFIHRSRQSKLDELARQCCQLLGVDRASFWRLTKGQMALEQITLFDTRQGFVHSAETIPQKDHPDYFSALLRERVIDASDAAQDIRTRSFAKDYLRLHGIHSMLDAPIFDHGQIYGILCLECCQPRDWTLPEVSFACALADTVSLINTYEAWQQSQQILDYVTHFDDLTGLCNFRALRANLDKLIKQRPQTGDNAFALAWINIDKLKQVNEGLGPDVGDTVIVTVAEKLRQLSHHNRDTIARLGGNEFALVVKPHSGDDTLAQSIDTFVEHVLEPLTLPRHKLDVTLTTGLCLYPEDGKDSTALLRHAEAAMYQAKSQGTNCAQFFNAQISRQAKALFALERDLREATERHTLDVYYQPIVAAGSGQLVTLEALVRWHHPQSGLLNPGEFLPLAKAAGLMYDIDQCVMHRVCQDLQQLQHEGLTPPRIAINLCAEQVLHPALADNIEKLLQYYQLPGTQLEFEVTEDVIQHDSRQLRTSLQALVKQGPTLAIDDFGTGYSSLSRLKHLPFRKLKIDRSFINDLPLSGADCAIIHSILGLARGLDMSIVAEGVESDVQQQWLHQQGVDYLQGYKFARPMALAALSDWLHSRGPT